MTNTKPLVFFLAAARILIFKYGENKNKNQQCHRGRQSLDHNVLKVFSEVQLITLHTLHLRQTDWCTTEYLWYWVKIRISDPVWINFWSLLWWWYQWIIHVRALALRWWVRGVTSYFQIRAASVLAMVQNALFRFCVWWC